MGSKALRLSEQEKTVIRAIRAGRSFQVVATAPSAPAERTFATKAERKAGNGFACPQCARTDLRVAPVVGRSFHDKDVKGNSELCDLR